MKRTPENDVAVDGLFYDDAVGTCLNGDLGLLGLLLRLIVSANRSLGDDFVILDRTVDDG